jgi:selenide,water dikinase
MQAAAPPILRDLVLVGGGHSHVGVLRAFGMQPLAGLRITLVCTDAHTPYSGMLPGYVAGHYDFDAVHLDLVRLCVFAGARFVRAQVTGLDRERRQVLLADRPPLDYDLVSINTGSTPHTTHIAGADAHAISVKPIAAFNQRWLTLLAAVRAGQGPRHIAVVGAGAGGVELLLAMQYRLRAETQALGGAVPAPQFSLFSATASVLPTHNTGVQRKFAAVLRQRGVDVHLHTRVQSVNAQGLRSADGTWHAADAVFWVTQAAGGAWLQGTGLALDAAGCVRVNAQLQSISDARIFAAGDVASLDNRSLEKAGVFAVRMGMPLARNLRRALTGQALQPYRAQARWLALISTGDRYAVASRGGTGLCRGLGVALERPHRPAFHAPFFRSGRPGHGQQGPWQRASCQPDGAQRASCQPDGAQRASCQPDGAQRTSCQPDRAQRASCQRDGAQCARSATGAGRPGHALRRVWRQGRSRRLGQSAGGLAAAGQRRCTNWPARARRRGRSAGAAG